MNNIVVTGMGVISAIGHSVAQNRLSLLEGRCGITPLELFESKFAGVLPCGEVKNSTESLRHHLRADEPGVTRTDLLALHAFDEAVRDAHLSSEECRSSDTALVVSSTVGGMCQADALFLDGQRQENGSEYVNSYDCSSVALYLQQRYQVGGVVNTINTACSSSANGIMYGARLIRNGLATRVIVGGVDSLAKFTINGFNALHILSPAICRPFDERRSGLNLGEGAAFLVLEKAEAVQGKRSYGAITGYCNSNDAYHPSSLSDNADGPRLAMKGALETAGIAPSEISFINAHGTATENNDLVESRAMLALFDVPPPFSSTKGNTGHTLGAAGAVEAVYSVLSLHHQELYPGLNFAEPIATTGLVPVQTYQPATLSHVMSNSFGFGGNCTSLVFSRS